jgi:hypothetical protein
MNRVDVVQLLINSRASLNLQDNIGRTALDYGKLNTSKNKTELTSLSRFK